MTDIDIEAIRKRDADWRNDGRRAVNTAACSDRRQLLQLLDELTELAEEIAADIRLIKRVQRVSYQPKPPPTTEEIEVALREQHHGTPG